MLAGKADNIARVRALLIWIFIYDELGCVCVCEIWLEGEDIEISFIASFHLVEITSIVNVMPGALWE